MNTGPTPPLTDIVLLTLRFGPLLAWAPPFSYIRAPMRVRLCLVLAMATMFSWMHADRPSVPSDAFVSAAMSELVLGLMLAFGLQAAFGALMFAGRVLDVQAGFGLAMVIDPSTRGQAPLFGTVLTLVAGFVFFAMNGHLELVRLLQAMLVRFPLGQTALLGSPTAFTSYLTMTAGLALGAVAAASVTLFLIDASIAYLTRALPQMNALMLGLQVKTLTTLVVTALAASVVAPVSLRLMRLAIDFVPDWLAR